LPRPGIPLGLNIVLTFEKLVVTRPLRQSAKAQPARPPKADHLGIASVIGFSRQNQMGKLLSVLFLWVICLRLQLVALFALARKKEDNFERNNLAFLVSLQTPIL
jgi:hypothetical protein